MCQGRSMLQTAHVYVQLWIRSAEPPGEHRYENRNNNNKIDFILLARAYH